MGQTKMMTTKFKYWQSSRGGLVVGSWTDNSLPSAKVGSNLHQVWCINRSVEVTLCYNSNCVTPGLRVYNTCLDDSSRRSTGTKRSKKGFKDRSDAVHGSCPHRPRCKCVTCITSELKYTQ